MNLSKGVNVIFERFEINLIIEVYLCLENNYMIFVIEYRQCSVIF